ncbi:MAG: hypothetical protein N2513_07055 [Deltaproteobacteria bacterium]|nr:hypothetical protein [Deltaproteobacteria bacterium]
MRKLLEVTFRSSEIKRLNESISKTQLYKLDKPANSMYVESLSIE